MVNVKSGCVWCLWPGRRAYCFHGLLITLEEISVLMTDDILLIDCAVAVDSNDVVHVVYVLREKIDVEQFKLNNPACKGGGNE
jgi:protoporphyrinogen oxidase